MEKFDEKRKTSPPNDQMKIKQPEKTDDHLLVLDVHPVKDSHLSQVNFDYAGLCAFVKSQDYSEDMKEAMKIPLMILGISVDSTTPFILARPQRNLLLPYGVTGKTWPSVLHFIKTGIFSRSGLTTDDTSQIKQTLVALGIDPGFVISRLYPKVTSLIPIVPEEDLSQAYDWKFLSDIRDWKQLIGDKDEDDDEEQSWQLARHFKLDNSILTCCHARRRKKQKTIHSDLGISSGSL